MRFKKLKISVAIALILFILLVGNILAFGYIQDVNAAGKSADNSPILNLLAPVYYPDSSGKSSTATSASAAQAQPQKTQSTASPIVSAAPMPKPAPIVHSNVVTRAS